MNEDNTVSDKERSLQGDTSASSTNTPLKTRNGIILMPQPSDDPNDPLNWSPYRKRAAITTIAYLALVSYVAVTTLVPATLDLAKQFGVSKATAIYLGSTPVALYGVAPWLWSPLSHVIGRRPVLILSNIIAIVGTVVAATSKSYGSCMAGRVILGAGGSAFWTLGPATIGDIFFRHEKGKMIGITSIAIVVSPFVGSIVGGAILHDESLGWPATQWIPVIFLGVGLIAQIFTLPETIYIRDRPESTFAADGVKAKSSLWSRYGVNIPKRSGEKHQGFLFVATRPFVLFKYPAVILSSIWFGIAYMMHVGITSEIPLMFIPKYGFTELEVGLSAFSGLIGCLIGEAWAGPSIDMIAQRALKQGREWKPEMRLKAIWPALIAVPGGLIMFGVGIQFSDHWITPLIGQAFYIFGIEVGTTVL